MDLMAGAVLWRRTVTSWLLVGVACVNVSTARAEAHPTGSAAKLRLVYEEMTKPQSESRFRRPMKLESVETSNDVSGEAFGMVDHPFAGLSAALADPAHWCDILILHLNNKECRLSTTGGAAIIHLKVARKYDQTVEQAFPIEFSYRLVESTPQYMAVHLRAAEGPMGTKDFHIVLEAIPTHDGHSFLHLTYSYGYGFTTQMGMSAYFATVGRGKVGFTVTAHPPHGQPEYIGGMRGLVERNTMRYFLAVEAYLGMVGAPGPEQFQGRLRRWFDATEQHARQLHEVDKQTYIDIKTRERGAATATRN